MVDSPWRRTAALLLVPAAVACAGVAGCSRAASHPAMVASSASGKPSAGPFSAAKLRDALLTRVNGVAAVAPAATGDYASLPDGSAGKPSATAVRVTPSACGGATMTGFNPAVLAGSPAAAATFRVGKNGVSEMLVASSVRLASTALAGQLPAQCANYKETVEGKTFRYTAKESAITGIGTLARVLNVRPSGGAVDNLWSLVYQGAGFVGSVTVIGPNASEAAVRELGEQAYAFAVKSLS
jgi:hypothetical protein